MSALIHIIHRDESDVINSTIITICDIAEIHCIYPRKTENKDEQYIPSETINEMHILLNNGEKREIIMSSPTIIRLLYEDKVLEFEGSELQKFEQAYMNLLVGDYESNE